MQQREQSAQAGTGSLSGVQKAHRCCLSNALLFFCLFFVV